MYHQRWTLVVAFSSMLFLGSARAQEPANLKAALLGKWTKTEKIGGNELMILIEFSKDDKVKVTVKSAEPIIGTYKVLDGKAIAITLGDKTSKLQVEVSSAELITTDKKGRKDTFTRTK